MMWSVSKQNPSSDSLPCTVHTVVVVQHIFMQYTCENEDIIEDKVN